MNWWLNFLKSRYAKQITPNQRGSHFFDPNEDVGHQVNAFLENSRGLTTIVTLRSEDMQALRSGQVLIIAPSPENEAIAIMVL